MRRLDDTNLHLLSELQKDARVSVAELARRVRRSEATVRERISQLESSGILRGYRADIDLGLLGFSAQAIVRANIDRREVPRLAKALRAIPNIVSADGVSGDRPVRMRVVARTVQEVTKIFEQRLSNLGLDDLDTRIILGEIVPNRVPDLVALLAEEASMRPTAQAKPIDPQAAVSGPSPLLRKTVDPAAQRLNLRP